MSRVSVSAPSFRSSAQAITPSDAVELVSPAVGLFVGGAGNVVAVTEAGEEITFTGITAGTLLPFVFRQIKATGTTATSLVGGK